MSRLILAFTVAVLVAFGIGWGLGRSGTSEIAGALQAASLRDSLLEGRAAVLDARLDIYSVNFGEASRNLEAARTALRTAVARLNDRGSADAAKRLEPALARIDDAQRLAGKLNQDANSAAADAARIINDVLGSK